MRAVTDQTGAQRLVAGSDAGLDVGAGSGTGARATLTLALTLALAPAASLPAPLAWKPVGLIVALTGVAHLAVLTRYGWHRDELYYVVSGAPPGVRVSRPAAPDACPGPGRCRRPASPACASSQWSPSLGAS